MLSIVVCFSCFDFSKIETFEKFKGIKTISGDVSEKTESFWLSVGAKIKDDEFLIKCYFFKIKLKSKLFYY
jgi:hypothetical protein